MIFTRIDTKKLVARFGGRIELWRRLEARGFKLSVKTIEKWMERDNIPANRIVQLLELAQFEKKPIDLNDYVLRPTKKVSTTDENQDQKETDGPHSR